MDRQPEQLKLPSYLWTREVVVQLIAKRFGIQLSFWTVGRYLAGWGFTPQKPVRREFEKNAEAVRRWLEEDYPAIQKQSRIEKASIYWGDEMGMRSDHAKGGSYGRRAQTPVISVTGQRFGSNMISAITNKGQFNFVVFKKRFRTNVFLEFLKKLLRQRTGKIFLTVVDDPVPRAIKIRNWIEKKGDHLVFSPRL